MIRKLAIYLLHWIVWIAIVYGGIEISYWLIWYLQSSGIVMSLNNAIVCGMLCTSFFATLGFAVVLKINKGLNL